MEACNSCAQYGTGFTFRGGPKETTEAQGDTAFQSMKTKLLCFRPCLCGSIKAAREGPQQKWHNDCGVVHQKHANFRPQPDGHTMSALIKEQDVTPLTSRLGCVMKAFLHHPGQVATVMPSSTKLISTVANRQCVQEATTVVELGPGAGGTTTGLLSNMRPDSNLLAIEKTQAFDEALGQISDPRLRVEYADAIRLLEYLQEYKLGLVDVVVSGIPFSSIPKSVANRIAQSVYEALRTGGTFIAYQLHDDVERYTRPLFGPPRTDHVLWNLPPLTVYSWTKIDVEQRVPS